MKCPDSYQMVWPGLWYRCSLFLEDYPNDFGDHVTVVARSAGQSFNYPVKYPQQRK